MQAHIMTIATSFVRGLIAPFASQSRNVGPNNRCCKSHFSNRGLLRLKQNSAMIMKTVEGRTGKK
jgi:hypothetical protein